MLCYIDLEQLSITVEGNQAFVTKLYCYWGSQKALQTATVQTRWKEENPSGVIGFAVNGYNWWENSVRINSKKL